MRRAALILAAALGMGGLFTAPLPGAVQADTAGARPAPAPGDTLGRVAGVERPRSTGAAVTVIIPRGSATDPEGKAGASWLLAHTLAEAARERVSPLSSRVTVRVSRSRSSFTLLAPRDGWRAPLRELLTVLFRSPLRDDLVEGVREGLLEQLRFEADAPVRRFQQEANNLIHGSSSPWSRPVRGNPTSVESVTPADLDALRAEAYRQQDAVAVAVGPGPGEVEGVLASGAEGLPRAPVAPAWTRGDRLVLSREVTSSWVAVAYPVAPDLPRTQADFLRHVLRETLVSTPPDPGLFGADVRLETGEGARPVLVVTAAVVAEMATTWEDRVLNAVSSLAREPESLPFFLLQRRRYRSEALLARAIPEGESRDGALDLLRRGRVREVAMEIDDLTPRQLHQAAAGLGPPRILILGPDLSQEEP